MAMACRSLSALFRTWELPCLESVSCAGCVLIQFLIWLHVLLSSLSGSACYCGAGLWFLRWWCSLTVSSSSSSLRRWYCRLRVSVDSSRSVCWFSRLPPVRELFHLASVFSSDGCGSFVDSPFCHFRPRAFVVFFCCSRPSASSVSRTCRRIRVIFFPVSILFP